MARFGLLLVAAACSSARQQAQAPCEAALACASVVNPFLVRDFDASWGEDGVCWETVDDPALCGEACTDTLVGLWVEYDHAEPCDPAEWLEPGSLSADQFVAQYQDAYCTALETCNEGYDACERYSGYGNPFGDCEDYDPVAADACLAGEMVCTDTPYFSNPIPPSICVDVCR